MRATLYLFCLTVWFAGWVKAVEDQAPLPPQAPRYEPILPDGSESYVPTKVTQRIAVTDGVDTIRKVPIGGIASKWHQSGGMEGIDRGLWTSEKFRLWREGDVKTWIGDIAVWNGSDFQNNRGIKQSYADGTRFDDVLRNKDRVVFEHRVREKRDGKWSSKVVYADESARPKGYTGLIVTCASCHDQAGTGGYATGLVPGGDTVISEPLHWGLVGK